MTMLETIVTAGASLLGWAGQVRYDAGQGLQSLSRPTYTPSSKSWNDVPVGAPEVGNYSGLLRPQAHFSPPSNFLNDPDGLFRDAQGVWHLYYEHNPIAPLFGNSTWGHATSTDLHTWVNQPIVLFPPNTTSEIFTGSVVVDPENTSGFFPGQDNGVVALYTLHALAGTDSTSYHQNINLAYSRDGGYTFDHYDGNPLIDVGLPDFRDTKVFWYEDHWVMVVALSAELTLGVYISKDLKDWALASQITNDQIGVSGLQYECPNLIKVPLLDDDGSKGDMVWVLDISVNPGAPQGGSITQFFPGDFNGTHFRKWPGSPIIGDFGKDNYAGQFFTVLDDDLEFSTEAINLAWASNWQYTDEIPTAHEGWRGMMHLPRRNHLAKGPRPATWDLYSFPYALDTILGDTLGHSDNVAPSSPFEVNYSHVASNAVYMDINVTLPHGVKKAPGSKIEFSFSSPITGEKITGGTRIGGDFYMTRDQTFGFTSKDSPYFTGQFSVASVDNPKRITAVFDRSIVEMFLDKGRKSGTMAFYPTSPLTSFRLEVAGLPEDSRVEVGLKEIRSMWKGLEGDDGLVRGNVSVEPT